MEQQRIFSASDLAQFEYCPLAWWYEEVSDLAQADPEELAERLKEWEEEYGEAAAALPEYQVMERLRERAKRFAQGQAQHTAEATQQGTPRTDTQIVETPVPRIFLLIVTALAALTVALLGLGLLLWLR